MLQRSLTVPDTANANLQNQINISIIFNYLCASGTAYRAQIARDMGMSAPAVSRAIEKLLKDNYLIESGKVRMGNGRKAAQVSLNAGRGRIVGIDLLSDPVKVAISDFAGNLLYSRDGPPVDEESDFSTFVISAIGDALAAFPEEAGTKPAPVLAIGIGIPAVVDQATGRIVSASLYRNLAPSRFREEIAERFGAPVFVENISNLAAIGEWKRGVGRDARNLLFIEVSNGIGAGVILDGNLYRGHSGSAGEIGYFLTRPEALGHDSSKKGYLESIASLAALRAAASGLAERGLLPSGPDPAAALFLAASGGNEHAIGVIGEALRHLALSIVNLMILLNPEIVVLGGSVFELPGAEELLARPLMDEILRNYPFEPAILKRTALGSRASVIGALQYALDSLLVHAHPYRL